MLLHCLLSTILSLRIQASAKSGIGQGFFLSDKNILGEDFTEGSSVFDSIQDDCLEDHQESTLKDDTLYFNTTSEFSERVTNLVKLGGGFTGVFTMKGTFRAVKESTSSKTDSMAGLLLRKQNLKKYTRMTQKCMDNTPLSPTLLKDLENLPAVIKNPQSTASWKEYNDLLNKYGSHILTTIHYGTLMDSWTISESSERYSQTQFEMKACLDLLGIAGGLFCTQYSKEQIQKASNFKMSKSLTLLGGSSATKTKLQQHFTTELLQKFMQEAETSAGPVIHDFKPIWEVLREYNTRIQHENITREYNTRLLNLEQYYQGMLDFGCSCQADGSVILRKFFLDNGDKTKPSYSCRIPPLGCRNDDDCHFSWGACYCYGESCVDGTDITDIFDTKKSSRFIRREQIGSLDEGINKDCKYVSFKGCKCKNTKTVWTTIWPVPDRLADNVKVALDTKITFPSSGKTSPSKNTIIEAITDVFKSYIFDLISVRVENITNSGQISVRVKFGTNMFNGTIPEKDFRRAIKGKYGRLGKLGINPDSINVEYFGVQLSGWTVQPGTCADGTTLKTRRCTKKELKGHGVTKDNCVDYYVSSNNTKPISTEPPSQGPTVSNHEVQCDPCICPEHHKTSSGVTHTVFNFLFIAPLILSAWFRG